MTASHRAPDQRSAADGAPLRLVLVPTPQPPLEDERIPLRLVLPGIAAPRPAHRPGPRPSTGRAAGRPDDDFGPTWSVRADLPDVREAGRRVITCALEALAGRRAIGQLRPMTSLRVFTALTEGRRPRWCAEGSAPLLVGRVHVCEPVDGVAEVSAVVRRGGRAHAVAARLEGIDGRWRCTALQIG
ncbi:Rv3235 family protein [Blastococcus deserti]|uniref:Rv3235 family protein n=1 Tax=Blastococcus deserti TaxID=2259033 RepID=A0ABW4X6R8_9ACTN